MRFKPVVMLAEDDDVDATLLERAVHRVGALLQLERVRTGSEAIAYLEGSGAFVDRAKFPPPALVLLDLRMPDKDGFDVLAWRQAVPARLRIPVIVLTSSSLEAEINRAYQLGANSYVVKPTNSGRLDGIVAALEDWWIRYNVSAKPILT